MPVGVGVDRGSQGLDALECANGLWTGMYYLGDESAARIGDALGKGFELGNKLVLVQCGGLADVPVFVVNGDSVDNDITHTAFRSADKDICQLLWNGAVSSLVVHAHGSHCNTVFKGSSADLQGSEKLRVFHVGNHASFSFFNT